MLTGSLFVSTIVSGGQAASPLMPREDAGGGGGSAVVVTNHQTTNARSIALIESKEAPGGVLAGIPAAPSRIPYAESERAVAQNRNATSTALAPQRTSPEQPYF